MNTYILVIALFVYLTVVKASVSGLSPPIALSQEPEGANPLKFHTSQDETLSPFIPEWG